MDDFLFLLKKCILDIGRRQMLPWLPFPMKLEDDEVHLRETMAWLARALEHGRGGVSSHYSPVHRRWLPPFPETTGYIIPTFYAYAHRVDSPDYMQAANRMADWLGDVQLPDGACMQGLYEPEKGPNAPIVFNTGQNVFGFLQAYRETGRARYLENALRAGDFLTHCVDDLGIWNAYLHNGIPHTYNTRTAWALLELYTISGRSRYRDVALANLDWVLEQQTDNGWFRNANFKPQELPNTHGLAYTIRGLVEAYGCTGEQRYLNAAKKTADKFQRLFEIRKFLYTFWDDEWKNHGKYFPGMKGAHICVTGNIQLALVWMRLFEYTGDATYVSSAFKMLDFVKTLQDVTTRHEGVRGGVPGAFPFSGSYSALKYPNWAAKFFADALMLKMDLQNDWRVLRIRPHQFQMEHVPEWETP